MPRINRSEICAPEEVQVFHLMNRCVRSSFLCGKDDSTGRDYSHRRKWIHARMQELAAIFGLDILGYAVMSNHLHIVVRTRPDVVREWSDEQAARRWWNLFPARRHRNGSPADPTQQELKAISIDKSRMKERRRRLSDISWFMRCLAEPIARRANREDDVKGRFWDGRFRAVPLLDEAAIAACVAYVDLNPVRAGVSKSVATCEFTSARARLEDYRTAIRERKPDLRNYRLEHGPRANWVSPLPLQPDDPAVREIPAIRRASHRGCLPMTLKQYLCLLEYTAINDPRNDKKQPTGDVLQVLERLQLDANSWLRAVWDFGKLFRDAAGRPESRRAFREMRRLRRAAHSIG